MLAAASIVTENETPSRSRIEIGWGPVWFHGKVWPTLSQHDFVGNVEFSADLRKPHGQTFSINNAHEEADRLLWKNRQKKHDLDVNIDPFWYFAPSERI